MGRVGRPLSVCSDEAKAIMRDKENNPLLPLWDLVAMAEKGQAGSFRSFRIADLQRFS
jgi:hypothetical protein